MHVVTFYSFKGGVGRTLALVNIGVELANKGRKVLLVDFDLEAPGIDTFQDLAPQAPCPGVVDYISEYISHGSPPDFASYHYRAGCVRGDDGGLWVMPAGLRGFDYGQKLAHIDWQELYEQRSGFLLMEHLKQQWQETLNPDYVLIDSRTGHTEVGGICTRQLPDTTVVLFIPNEQNLDGVGSVVDAIKRQNKQSDVKINVELVASNVPALDDEHQILRAMMRRFESRLVEDTGSRSRSPISVINRYDSMHLLNQTIFVCDRPHSRLAKQYRSLMRRIVDRNLEDREAALRQISNQFPRPSGSRYFSLRAADFEPSVSAIESESVQAVMRYHADDAEINFMIGQLHKSRGDLEDAEFFFARAAELGRVSNDPNLVKYQLELIESHINTGKSVSLEPDLIAILEKAGKASEFQQCVSLLMRLHREPDDHWLEFDSVAMLANDEIDSIAWVTCSDRSWQKFSTKLYRQAAAMKGSAEKLELNSTLAAIGAGEFELVINSCDYENVLAKAGISDVFNLAMAFWGRDCEPDLALLHRVMELDNPEKIGRDANYQQCLALCCAVLGNSESAFSRLNSAADAIHDFSPLTFSCWSYLRLPESDFLAEVEDMRTAFRSERFIPKFVR